ncbi:MAG: hypothetical protein CM15mP6_2300 [Methanobacteriota archaeon]|nr:MAG: hypothetical protein CM15mP6_2300 [Euryarchaeota archaeon]
MANGPGEIILLCAGLIVAGLVSGVLLETWDDMDAALEDRGKEGAADVRTRASLVNDPLNIAWDNTEKTHIVLKPGENQRPRYRKGFFGAHILPLAQMALQRALVSGTVQGTTPANPRLHGQH